MVSGKPDRLLVVLRTLGRGPGKVIAAAVCLALFLCALPAFAAGWTEDQFEHRPLFAYPLPHGKDNIIGNLVTYQIEKGDTLLDVGRWFGVTAKEISDANGRIDWWTPPAGRKIVLPDEHILPDTPHVGIVLNIPEMRLYYYYPSPTGPLRKRKEKFGHVTPAAFLPAAAGGTAPKHGDRRHHHSVVAATVVYTFPVGLGRFDWKTPIGPFTVTGRKVDPDWVLPPNIYKEHLETEGEAEHVIPGGDPDNPLGHYKLDLSIPEYGIHGTNVPWGVGMEVSHGCIRLFPEDIEHLFEKVKVGTPGQIIYQPIKFGWRGDGLYVEVHDDLYGRYAGLWQLATQLVTEKGLEDQVDMKKLEKAVEEKTGVPTYVMPGAPPGSSETAAAK